MDVGGVGVGGIVYVDEAEGALEEFLDVVFADEFGGEQFVEFEIGEAAVGDAGGEDFEEALGVDGTEGADFFEDDALRVVDEFFRINEAAELNARDWFYEDGAEQAEQVAFGGDVFDSVGDGHCSRLEVDSAGWTLDAVEFVALLAGVAGETAREAGSCSRIRFSTRCQTFSSHSISMWLRMKKRVYHGYSGQEIGWAL